MFFTRLLLGLRCLASILKSGTLNAGLRHELGVVRFAPETTIEEDHGPIAASEERIRGAIQILRALQQASGFIDFLNEDLRYYSDQQLAQGVRAMQPHARDALARAMKLTPVVDLPEGEVHDLPPNPSGKLADGSLELDGNPEDFEAVLSGTLKHRGWRAAEVHLLTPPLTQDPTVLHPAVYEVE